MEVREIVDEGGGNRELRFLRGIVWFPFVV